jgi:hypothetical protein
MSEKDKKYVVTGECMLSYPHIAEPQKGKKPTDEAKFSAAFVFAPGYDLKDLQAAALTAAEEKWGAKAAEMFKNQALRSPLRRDAAAKGYPDGSVFLNARSNNQPQCVYRHAGPDSKPAVIPQDKIASELYAGAKVRVSLKAFVYDVDGNKGVSFALNNIQKLADGPRIDGRKAATDEFDADLSAPPVDLEAAGLI